MRIFCLFFGLLSLAAGVGQMIFVLWAGEASWHLGSPIRSHGNITGFFNGHRHQAAVENLYQTGMRVIDVLETSLGVLFSTSVLLIAIGVFLIFLFALRRRQAVDNRSLEI